MGVASNGVEEYPASSTPPQIPAIAAPVPPSASPVVDNLKASDSGNAEKTGAAAGDQEAWPTQETGTVEVIATGTRVDEEPAHGTNLSSSSPATPPKTPERDMAPPTRAGERAGLGAETAPADVDNAKPGGCTTPVHDVEGSDRRSPLHGEKPKPAGASLKRDVAAAKSRLLTFRSFSRDKQAGEDGAEHKEKGKERRKRFWK
ncbi:hypothetical protein PR202_ga09741 [Eleusine coracana subsp. coracana]|uniref:Uncharacterized protein n=1 Tax=Eleusine coracana subsp. coracana TaxID=191504 RepID=A0AAV5C549_ELECO|nr:hypothetical protein PR202_ga09741 [Eleusine coracana subsp. coracana]